MTEKCSASGPVSSSFKTSSENDLDPSNWMPISFCAWNSDDGSVTAGASISNTIWLCPTYILDNLTERICVQILQFKAPLPHLLCMISTSFLAWNDRDHHSLPLSATEDDLRSEARAKTNVSRERETSEAFQDRRLATALITNDDQLRQANVMSNIASRELVDLVEELTTSEASAAIADPALLLKDLVFGFEPVAEAVSSSLILSVMTSTSADVSTHKAKQSSRG